MSSELSLPEGSAIQGKWNRGEYRIERLLGAGSNGKVYLVRQGRRRYALKVGFDAVDHQSEVNALKALSRSSSVFGTLLHDVDDFTFGGASYPFAVLRYIEGQPLTDFIRDRGTDWLYVTGLHLLRSLAELHACGFVFGDLKAENVIVSSHGEVGLIDYGGVTAVGRSVKQFTEQYDRGYWNGGSRTANEAYDLFSFAVLMIAAALPEARFRSLAGGLPQNRSTEDLLAAVQGHAVLAPVAGVLRSALTGRYTSSRQMLADWRARSLTPPRRTAEALDFGWIPWTFAVSLILFAATVYLVFQ
ncbi:protein kinase domain-containing protein [Paenibacillus mucilaginosus]|uniref:non-specific serine/threonine protein kinase n=1 Tax=Paenibacillus mucilaginosus (strain KNP414) TaxID=1036673 RepID=F8FA98_PAEMK|nr:protein kinase [Paenibacillus mucilaginosus]AEI46071.1 serine/threonine protein kinase [Paenibacillus mucilaginosus KNP414]MCG7217911.1 protein kinase [Paenibacillus mucilaginosus]WDM31467.1 protein kinase [Paenibacillus mucilaginosus]